MNTTSYEMMRDALSVVAYDHRIRFTLDPMARRQVDEALIEALTEDKLAELASEVRNDLILDGEAYFEDIALTVEYDPTIGIAGTWVGEASASLADRYDPVVIWEHSTVGEVESTNIDTVIEKLLRAVARAAAIQEHEESVLRVHEDEAMAQMAADGPHPDDLPVETPEGWMA